MSYMKRVYEQKCTTTLSDTGTYITICNCKHGVNSHQEIEKRVNEEVQYEIASS